MRPETSEDTAVEHVRHNGPLEGGLASRSRLSALREDEGPQDAANEGNQRAVEMTRISPAAATGHHLQDHITAVRPLCQMAG